MVSETTQARVNLEIPERHDISTSSGTWRARGTACHQVKGIYPTSTPWFLYWRAAYQSAPVFLADHAETNRFLFRIELEKLFTET